LLIVSPELSIPEAELAERFIRAPGPGGQHVNRTESAVQLRFDAAHSPSLPEPVRQRLLALADGRITAAGEVVIEAHAHRERERNRAEARQRLVELLLRALYRPRPRRPTRPTRGSQERRLAAKRRDGAMKRGRGRRDWE